MKKLLLVFMLIPLFLFSKEITDQLGRKVTIPDEVNRIVVLQHQSLNLLNQINAMDKVVGILASWEKQLGKNYLRLAPTLKDLPMPGDLSVVNYEAVLALKPDVVIVTNYIPHEFIVKLEELKIPVVGMSFFRANPDQKDKLNPTFKDEEFSLDNGLYDGITLLGNIANREKEAAELIKYVKNQQKILADKTKNIKFDKRKRIYMANPDFTTYGHGKYTGVIFKRAGGENVAYKDLKGYQQISPERLLKYNPEIIFVQERYSQVIDELKTNAVIKDVDAIKNNRIYLMPEYAKAWGHPTPEAMALGEFWVAKTLYPDEFKDINLDKMVDDYYAKFYRTSYK